MQNEQIEHVDHLVGKLEYIALLLEQVRFVLGDVLDERYERKPQWFPLVLDANLTPFLEAHHSMDDAHDQLEQITISHIITSGVARHEFVHQVKQCMADWACTAIGRARRGGGQWFAVSHGLIMHH